MRLPRALLLLMAVAGCGSTTTPPADPGCDSLGVKHIEGGATTHLSSCSDPACGNGANPPTGGPHCATPLACQNFTAEQPVCNWVHNLEHGHLVLLYNC